MNPNRPTPRHIIIKIETFKDKERILKAGREKQWVIYKGTPIKLSLIYLQKQYRSEGVARYTQSPEKENPAT